jgi:flavin reductase ActVB
MGSAVSEDDFKAAMSHWASGVTVVTTTDAEGGRHGFTASSFTSVSLAPPMVLVCLDQSATCAPAFLSSGWFAVHVLAHEQAGLAKRFATKDADKFAGLDPLETGVACTAPVLPGALVVLECRMTDLVDAGDHTVLIAEVHHVAQARPAAGRPLIYFRRFFHRLA